MIKYRAEEVNSGICTCTLRASSVEKKINELAKEGWKFEESEPIIGRFCLFFSRYKMILIFSKETEESKPTNIVCESTPDFEIKNGVLEKYKGIDNNVVIPDNVTSIGAYAFLNCKQLTNVIIPNTVTTIGDSAFAGCENLDSVELPHSIMDIGINAFNETCKVIMK